MLHFMIGNTIELLRNGAAFFPALEAAIDQAQHEIYLQTYIFEADATGFRIGNALKKAALRGVMVNVLLDGFGSKDLSKAYIKNLEASGINVMFYRPKISAWTFKKNRLRRLHRKVTVVDGCIGFVGGINIIDDLNMPALKHSTPQPRLDYAVRIEGPLLESIHYSVRVLWKRMAWLHASPSQIVSASIKPHPSPQEKGVKAAFVLRDNLLHRRDIERAYLTAIAHAHTEIIIANAYFIPGKKFRDALINAASRGVRVKLLLQGHMEYFLMLATHAFYGHLLAHGIEIYEYQPSYMHSKVAVIDSLWATVGSSNIDPLSLMLAREANVVFIDKALGATLRAELLACIQNEAKHIVLQDWTNGHRLKRFASWCTYGLMRLFLGFIGLKQK